MDAGPPPARPLAVLVLGGTGFLGRRVVEALLGAGHTVRVGARRPAAGEDVFGATVETVHADLRDPATLVAAMQGMDAVVNAVSLYAETRQASFHDIHVAGARNVAEAAETGGLRLVHISGIGADPHAGNSYVRSRGRGEEAVRQASPGAILLRSAAMVGDGDALTAALADLVTRMRVVPLFGHGRTRLQPVHVEDVAAAVCRLATEGGPTLSEIGGPRILTYRELVAEAARRCGASPRTVPVPFAAWRALASAGRFLPRSPIDAGQVALMRRDTVAAPELDLRSSMALPARDIAGALDEACRRRGAREGRSK